jgi:hypothetical protein
MDPDTRQELTKARQDLYEMHAKGNLSDDLLHKGLICLAYRWVAGECIQEALDLLATLPLTYCKEILRVQMAEDPTFAQIAEALACVLLKQGIVLFQDFRPTQAPGRA